MKTLLNILLNTNASCFEFGENQRGSEQLATVLEKGQNTGHWTLADESDEHCLWNVEPAVESSGLAPHISERLSVHYQATNVFSMATNDTTKTPHCVMDGILHKTFMSSIFYLAQSFSLQASVLKSLSTMPNPEVYFTQSRIALRYFPSFHLQCTNGGLNGSDYIY